MTHLSKNLPSKTGNDAQTLSGTKLRTREVLKTGLGLGFLLLRGARYRCLAAGSGNRTNWGRIYHRTINALANSCARTCTPGSFLPTITPTDSAEAFPAGRRPQRMNHPQAQRYQLRRSQLP
jgi:hypothetical protein